MEFRTLRSFLAVARERSISGAARALHISQPSLSRQIMELEETLGVKLFVRGNRKITLTDQGALLRKRAEQIVELVHKTEEDLTAREGDVGGTIYIAAGETRAFRTLARSIRSLVEQFPDVRIHLSSGNEDDVVERLDKGLADFGLFIEAADMSKYEYLRLPAADAWGVLMRKDSPMAALDSVRPEDLWRAPLIASRQTMAGGQLSSWLKAEPEKLNVVATYNLLFNASLLVEAGLGYALCLDDIVDASGEGDLCFRPFKPALASHVELAWKKHQVFSKASELLLERIRADVAT